MESTCAGEQALFNPEGHPSCPHVSWLASPQTTLSMTRPILAGRTPLFIRVLLIVSKISTRCVALAAPRIAAPRAVKPRARLHVVGGSRATETECGWATEAHSGWTMPRCNDGDAVFDRGGDVQCAVGSPRLGQSNLGLACMKEREREREGERERALARESADSGANLCSLGGKAGRLTHGLY